MATYQPPKRGVEYIFYISLVSQADAKLLKANPTLAAGDVVISKDGGAFANLTTLPTVTPAAGKGVKVTVSATEMTADNVLIIFSDVAGAEWCDLSVNVATSAQQIDDLATQASVNTIDDFLDTEVAAILAAVDTEVAAIKAKTDNLPGATMAELAQGIPPATPSLEQALMALYMTLRNRLDVTATTKSVTNDAGTVIFKKALSDDGTTYSEAEAVSGP